MEFRFGMITFLSIFTSLNGFTQAGFSLPPEAIYQKTNAAVVFISTPQNRKKISYGSGFIIDPKGWIITVNHVVGNQQNVMVKIADDTYQGTVFARDRRSDLALIKLRSQKLFPSLRLQAIPPRIGQKIYVLGNPLTLEKSFADGLVSRLEDSGWIQYTAPTNPGNSGSPLLNEDGDVLGLVQLRLPDSTPGTFASGIYFAIPTSQIQGLLATVRQVPMGNRQASIFIANGLVQMRKGNYRQAIENYNRAIRAEPQSASSYLNRAAAQTLLKNDQLALEYYTRAIQINSNYSLAYLGRGRVYMGLKNYKKAIEDFDSAIRVNRVWGSSSLAAAYYDRGTIRVQLKEQKAAVADFKAAADLYLKQGRTAEYQQSLDRIIQLKTE